jgi:hypothetical protein
MNLEPNARHRATKRAATACGLAAAGAMIALGFGHQAPDATHATLAGSGDAPANTTYTQPAVSGMNVGATATWTAPASAPATSMAAPAIKGPAK